MMSVCDLASLCLHRSLGAAALAHKLHSSSPPPLASSSFCSYSSECFFVSMSISQDFSMESYVSFIVFPILPYLLKHVSEISNLNSPTGGTFLSSDTVKTKYIVKEKIIFRASKNPDFFLRMMYLFSHNCIYFDTIPGVLL